MFRLSRVGWMSRPRRRRPSAHGRAAGLHESLGGVISPHQALAARRLLVAQAAPGATLAAHAACAAPLRPTATAPALWGAFSCLAILMRPGRRVRWRGLVGPRPGRAPRPASGGASRGHGHRPLGVRDRLPPPGAADRRIGRGGSWCRGAGPGRGAPLRPARALAGPGPGARRAPGPAGDGRGRAWACACRGDRRYGCRRAPEPGSRCPRASRRAAPRHRRRRAAPPRIRSSGGLDMHARRAVVTLLAGGALAGAAVPALAHTEPVATTPREGRGGRYLPGTIALSFSQASQRVIGGRVLRAGSRVNHARSTRLNPRNARQVRIATGARPGRPVDGGGEAAGPRRRPGGGRLSLLCEALDHRRGRPAPDRQASAGPCVPGAGSRAPCSNRAARVCSS